MKPAEGIVVAVRHYSMISLFNAIVEQVREQSIVIRLPKECMKSTFLAGDPIVTSFEKDSKAFIRGGRILGFNRRDELLEYSEDEFDEGSRMRSYERFPVSLYADYRVAEAPGNKKYLALVKDISDYGLMIYSREPHFKGLTLMIDIYLARDILSLTAEIVRQVQWDGYYEYGLKIRHNGPIVFNHIKTFVKKEQDELIGKYER
ncbi:MAG: PilZ domain-containing protein [Clostridiaceae bacterium]|jgi:hypothetical protein|nr:PilZ domain-containing protein [Clostridiaceae bacterium]